MSAQLCCQDFGFSGVLPSAQLTGILAVGAFVSVTSAALWLALKAFLGIRVSEEHEELGLDKAELGMEAYPEFGHGSQRI